MVGTPDQVKLLNNWVEQILSEERDMEGMEKVCRPPSILPISTFQRCFGTALSLGPKPLNGL